MTFQDSLGQRERDIRALQACGIEEFQIENTSRCNFDCFMCPRRGRGKDMSDSLAKVIIGRFPAIARVTLNGLGEPFLSHNIVKFVKNAKHHGHHVFIPTNAFPLTDAVAKLVVDTEVDQVNISIDAATPSAFREIHGVAAFERVVGNARSLVTLRNRTESTKPKLSLCVVMSTKNLHQLPDLVRLACDIGIGRVVFINLTPCREEHLDQILYAFPGRELPRGVREARDASLAETWRTADEVGVELDAAEFEFREARGQRCSNLGRKLYVSADGDVSVCPIVGTTTPRLGYGGLVKPTRYVFGNLKKASFEAILNSSSFKRYQSCVRERIVPQFCLGCNWIHGL